MSLMLIDAAGLYFRAFYGVPDSVTSPDGKPINAVRGFLDMSATLIQRRRPSRYVACLDLDWRPAFRVALIPSYKRHRVAADGGEEIPAALSVQVPVLLQVLEAIGLATAGAEGFEADDVIATLAHRDSDPCDVVTGDRDLLALATDRVRILYTGKGVAKLQDFGPDEIEAKYGVPAAAYADFAALRGDPSDGLPGVAGVGDKTAATLVQTFGRVEDIIVAAASNQPGFPSGSAAKVLGAREYLGAATAVVRGRIDVPLPALADELPAEPANPELLIDLVDRYGIERSVNRVLNAIQGVR
ncbi:5'-3' exonuclease [Jatrophihabitans sp. GAS493]|uniref:5'-3' exonuclease n=1 Tax=Jatrophihabitans sp. GAS493 TaxID=1907575 RepID=UPI000BC075E7|nr:5'-3' exonuclease [Jatrophihabitans sp. GAS493]SOD73900.1 5'-3' exonuclease [Jatrophihabitans sp. GAS493]